MKHITSPTHPAIKLAASLHHAKYRKEHGLFIAEGIRTTTTLLQAGMQLEALFMIDAAVSKFLIDDNKIFIIPEALMKKISTSTTPSGVLSLFCIKQNNIDLTSIHNGIVLAKISDPGNMGTIIRTAAAMNVNNIIAVDGVDPWHPRVVQATAGTIGMVNIIETDWQTLHAHHADKLCALVATDGKKPEELDKSKQRLLVVGNEAHGIPSEWLADCNEKLTLPMPGKTESLNAAIAASIALYLLST